MIIGLTGKKGCGKDTTAQIIKKNFEQQGYRVALRAFADPLKKICQELFLLTDDQLYDQTKKEEKDTRWSMTPRKMFQWFGTDCVRKRLGGDFWIRHLAYWHEQNWHTFDVCIITDIRFQNELDFVKEMGGTVIKINRSTHFADNHESEIGIDYITGTNYTVENNGSLDELEEKIAIILHDI